MLDDRHAHRRALLSVLHALIQSALCQSDGRSRHRRPRSVKDLHGNHETIAFSAQSLAFRHDEFIKSYLGGIRRALAQLVEFLADAEAGAIALDDERADA